MKFARIVDGHAAEVFTPPAGFTLTDCFHAEVAALFTSCPDNVVIGAKFDGKAWTLPAAPEPAAPVAAPLAKLTPMAFYLAFTPAERIAIKKSADPVVGEFWDTYQLATRTDTPIDPNLASVAGGLAYLRAVGILESDERVALILAGTAQ